MPEWSFAKDIRSRFNAKIPGEEDHQPENNLSLFSSKFRTVH